MKRRVFAAAFTVITLAGCSPNNASASAPRGDSGSNITTIALRDGTPCAFIDGAETKALSCNWGSSVAPAPGVDPHGDRGTTVTLVTLPDGTACAVADGKPGKALDCDWKR